MASYFFFQKYVSHHFYPYFNQKLPFSNYNNDFDFIGIDIEIIVFEIEQTQKKFNYFG
jgi:hypothetical protein